MKRSLVALAAAMTCVASAAPEPPGWAMMIAGIGMVGGTIRRRRGLTDIAYA